MMNRFKYMKPLSVVFIFVVLMFPLVSCEEDTPISIPGPDDLIDGGYDPVFSADGGFVITYGMLTKRYNEITYPGTHNSYAGIGSNWPATCKNQGLTIAEQLERGIRYIEFDIDRNLYVNHNGWCSGYLDERLRQIKSYVQKHPNQIFTVRIADLSETSSGADNAPSPEEAYRDMNERLREIGLHQYIYNWSSSSGVGYSHPAKCYIPDPWPTLREMIESGKNIMFIHNRDYAGHGIVDEGLCRGLAWYDDDLHYFFEATQLEQFSRLLPIWLPPRTRQNVCPYRAFLIECCPDGNAPAGDREYASKNNDGRKLYQVAKRHEDDILPDNRAVNFIMVDYFMSSFAWNLPIDVVDACNRLNYERVGSNWEESECFWELCPYEFDDSKVEHIGQTAEIIAELEWIERNYWNRHLADVSESEGKVVSTDCHIIYDSWKRLPEWAVDNDLCTRWCGNSSNDGHTWGIDLGERKSIDEIAIAWEFSHKRPAYTVFASNDDARFADHISNQELIDDSGWVVVAQGAMQINVYGNLWDMPTFDGNGVTDWRYFKIQVTDADSERWPSFWEVKLYGPAN